MKKRCGGHLHYENLAGVVRVFKLVEGKRTYSYRCPSCKAEGTNDGRATVCVAMVAKG